MITTKSHRTSQFQRQQGMATILVVLMISLGMSVAAIGVVYSLRGGQEVQVAVHAKTNSQAAAWAGVEVFRTYLADLAGDPTNLEALASVTDPLSINIQGSAAVLAVENLDVQLPTSAEPDFLITANIRGTDTAARSSTVLQVQYRVDPGSCPDSVGLDNTLDFRRGLNLGGEITVEIDSDSTLSPSLYIEGNVDTGGINLNGVNRVYATGNISIGSAVTIPALFSNGDISLVGSANVDVARAVGSLFVDSGQSRINQEAYINGTVVHQGGNSGKIYSLDDVTMTGWGDVELVNTRGTVINSAVSIENISAKGDVTVQGNGSNPVDTIVSEGLVSCPQGWSSYGSIKAKQIDASCAKTGSNSVDPATTVSVMNDVKPFSMQPVRVDAWMLRQYANYAFWYDGSNMRVTVSDINTVPDGDYYMVTHAQATYICKSLTSGSCNTAETFLKICNGNSNYNTCASYDTAAETWRFDGKNLAPGVVWVEGNLSLVNGYYFNTFVATKTITTSGAHVTKALSFAGYDIVCNNGIVDDDTFLTDAEGYQGGMTPFTDMYPTNVCDIDNGVLKEDATIANIALLAGGYPDPDVDAYEGGDINLGASTEVFGSVMAGNYLDTGGDTTVHGYISASGLGTVRQGTPNKLSASTTVDLRSLPTGYDNSKIPNMDPNKNTCIENTYEVSKVFWSRYL